MGAAYRMGRGAGSTQVQPTESFPGGLPLWDWRSRGGLLLFFLVSGGHRGCCRGSVSLKSHLPCGGLNIQSGGCFARKLHQAAAGGHSPRFPLRVGGAG